MSVFEERIEGSRHFLAGHWLTAGLLLAFGGCASEPADPEALDVHRGQIERGESVTFPLEVAAPGIWRAACEQRGIDLELVVRDDGEQIVGRVISPLHRKGSVRWTGSLAAGTYQVELVTREDTAVRGTYELTFAELTGADARLQEAEQAVARAGTALAVKTAESDRSAFNAYGMALPHWRKLGHGARELETLYAIARLEQQSQNLPAAVERLEQVAALAAELQRPLFEASALADLGLALRQQGELSAAETRLLRAAELYDTLGEPLGSGTVRNTLAMIVHSRGDLRRALDGYFEALAQVREAESMEHQAAILNNIGYAYDSLGEPDDALSLYRQALEIRRRLHDRAGEAQTLNNMAAVKSRGDGEAALELYGQARVIWEQLGQPRGLAAVINNQAEAYRRLGKGSRALVFFEQALELRRQAGDRRGELVTLNGVGLAHRQRGELELARGAHQRALELSRQVERQRAVGLSLAYLGRVELEAGEPEQGLEHLDEAVKVLGEHDDLFHAALAWHYHGVGWLQAGEPAKAEASLRRALALREDIADRVGQADTQGALATLLAAGHGDLTAAVSMAADALESIEEAQRLVAGAEVRMSFLAARASAYELMIELLMERHRRQPGAGFARRAFEIADRSKARTLVQALAREHGAGVEESVLERQRQLRRRLSAKANRLVKLRGAGKGDSLEVRRLELELESILAELDVVARQRSEEAGRLNEPAEERSIVDLEAMRRALGSEAVLLEYALGTERSYAWRLDEDGLEVFELSPRRRLEDLARTLHRSWSTAGDLERDAELASELSRRVLEPVLGPMEVELPGRRVVIVADGALHHVPFAALPIAGDRLLVQAAEVVHAPSMSWLVNQASRSAEPAPHTLAVFADPVFDPTDPRLEGPSKRAGHEHAEPAVLRDVREAGIGPLNRLPASRHEAEKIASLASGGDVWLAFDLEASRQAANAGRLRDFRFLHFATHGLVSEDQPALSGLALSMVEAGGRPVDGFLRVHEIQDLDLRAELVVLSGCRTALGQSVRGEGLVGLARGFLGAGAQRVVASLWWVEDRATARLMERFYRAMWQDGLEPSAALRRAQLEWLATGRKDPSYWAAFVHQGL